MAGNVPVKRGDEGVSRVGNSMISERTVESEGKANGGPKRLAKGSQSGADSGQDF
jgi:hypothetical protein